jgi:SAM-dependent methyltransferase
MDKKIYYQLAAAGRGYWWNQGRQHLVTELVKKYLGQAGSMPRALKILDIGCAAGGTLAYLGAWGEAWGLDIAPEAVELCRTWGLPPDHLILGSAEGMPFFHDRQFDLITAVEILEHLAAPEKALQEIYRILKPNGLLILTVPADQKLWSDRDVRLGHRRRYQLEELEAAVAATGLNVVKSSYANTFYYWPFRLILAWRRKFGRKIQASPTNKDTFEMNPLLSGLLVGLLKMENRMILRGKLKQGVSVICAAKK